MLRMILVKKDAEASHWKRLTKEETKFKNISIKWSLYVDSDDEEAQGQKGLGKDWNPD